MNRLLLGLLIYTFSFNVLAMTGAEQCQTDALNSSQCGPLYWRDQAAYADSGLVRSAAVSDNVERTLEQVNLTLWGLGPVPPSASKKHANAAFATAQTTLSEQTQNELLALISQLEKVRIKAIKVVGHADNQRLSAKAKKRFRDNQGLSVARAQQVADFMRDKLSLTDDQLQVSGAGDTQPIADNATAQGRAKNRRAVITALIETQGPVRTQICQHRPQKVHIPEQGFAISVDGVAATEAFNDGENQQRCTDKALAEANMQLQYDNLDAEPMLSSSAVMATATTDETVRFQGYSNYLAWIEKAEVRIFAPDQSVLATPLAIVPLDTALRGLWTVPDLPAKTLTYVLRVYGHEGHYDQTSPLPINIVLQHRPVKGDEYPEEQLLLSGYGKNNLARQQIPLSGGTVTLQGEGVPEGYSVYWLGSKVPVDDKQRYVAQQIIPRGRHLLEVAILDNVGNGQLFQRDIELKRDDWFHVGIIDITAGYQRSGNAAYQVTQNERLKGGRFVDGRLAFYSKGRWKDDYTVTFSVDSGEQPLNKLFSRLDDKNPRNLLRRLDETAFYPVYGDDSVTKEDAPTQGKVYARIEDARSHAQWGNFRIAQQQTELAQINRGLYGAVGEWKSVAMTAQHEHRTEINLYAAEPGSQASREEFRGTGGSLYYLRRQDIVTGSVRAQVVVKDQNSGIVVSRTTLVAGQDYDEDAVQGRIILTQPLPAHADASELVRAGSYTGHPVYLVVDYEFVSLDTNFKDLAIGGRASHWLNDSVRLGITSSKEQRLLQEQTLGGVDLLLQKTPQTYIRLELAHTQGPGVTASSSLDGGFRFDTPNNSVANSNSGGAYLIESGFELHSLNDDLDGQGTAYIRHRDRYFSALGQQTDYATDQAGAQLTLPLSEHNTLAVKADVQVQKGGLDKEELNLDVLHTLDTDWRIGMGVRQDNRDDQSGTIRQNGQGDRTDVALQVEYGHDHDWGIHGFAQGTLNRTGNRENNNRAGLGSHYRINDRLQLDGEISDGSQGFGASLGSSYRLSERTTSYLNYQLDPDQVDVGIGNRQGRLVTGVRSRLTDALSVYGEEQLLHGAGSDGLIHAYGVELIPEEYWRLGMSVENGKVSTDTDELRRNAISLSANYSTDMIRYGGNLEFRRDKRLTETRKSILMRNHLSYQLDPDWRMRLQLDFALSRTGLANRYDTDFVEIITGYAYRPIKNDRLNLLFEYKYLADQAPTSQLTGTGVQSDIQQRSHVLAVDGIYDLTPRWSIGGKYAVRTGELRTGRDGDWFRSRAQLAIARLDWHIVKNWEALLEARTLDVDIARDRTSGALISVHRHIGDHMKAGLGYNFTEFSSDLTDLDYDAEGVFVNVTGKW